MGSEFLSNPHVLPVIKAEKRGHRRCTQDSRTIGVNGAAWGPSLALARGTPAIVTDT